MPMSEWDALSDDDRGYALATGRIVTCPVCGGDDPDQLCQNPRFQHAWEVTFGRCYRSRAELMAMEPHKKDPYVSTLIPRVTLNLARAKPVK